MRLRTGSEIIGSANENKTGGNWGEEGRISFLFPATAPFFSDHALIFSRAFHLRVILTPDQAVFFFASLLLWLKRENRKQITEIKGEGMIAG